MTALHGGNASMDFMRARQRSMLQAIGASAPIMGISRVTQPSAGIGVIRPVAGESALHLSVQLVEANAAISVDGRLVEGQVFPLGSMTLLDHRREWAADMRSPFDAVNLHIPVSTLGLIQETAAQRHSTDLCLPLGVPAVDPAINGLVVAMLPALERPAEASQLFVDHVAWAIAEHLVRRYRRTDLARPSAVGLHPRQARLAMDFLEAKMSDAPTLSAVAEVCGLSIPEFISRFRHTTGLRPFQWLQARRLESATRLLRNNAVPIEQIAFDCGFADGDHLLRALARGAGIGPDAFDRRQ